MRIRKLDIPERNSRINLSYSSIIAPIKLTDRKLKDRLYQLETYVCASMAATMMPANPTCNSHNLFAIAIDYRSLGDRVYIT
jgi:hypothetical protein